MNARMRSMVMAVSVFALAALPFIPQPEARAQASDCCWFTIDNRTECGIHICAVLQRIESVPDTLGLTHTSTNAVCDTVEYGRHPVGIDGKGCSVMSLAIVDWNQNAIAIPMSPGRCLERVRIGPACAARVCFAYDPMTGCPVVEVVAMPGCSCK